MVLGRHLPDQRGGPPTEPLLGGLRAIGRRWRRTAGRRRPRAEAAGAAAGPGAPAGGEGAGAAGLGGARAAAVRGPRERRGGRNGRGALLGLDPRHHGLDRDGLTLLLDEDFGQDTGVGRRDFSVHLVGRPGAHCRPRAAGVNNVSVLNSSFFSGLAVRYGNLNRTRCQLGNTWVILTARIFRAVDNHEETPRSVR